MPVWSLRGWWLFILLMVRIILFPSSAYAGIPPAGESITSQSTASYRLNGNLNNISSNRVWLSVLPFYSSGITPDGTPAAPAASREGFPGETVTFPYLLRNSGNETGFFRLEVDQTEGSDFTMSGTAIYLDQDGDSLVGPGDSEVTTVGPLDMGEEASVILEAVLPMSGVGGGEIAYLDLTSRSVEDTSSLERDNVVMVTVRNDARVPVVVQTDRTEVLPGENIEYSVHFENTGEREADQVTISDYIDYTGINSGTELVPGTVTSTIPGAIDYFDIRTSQWVDVPPSAERVKGVRVSLETLLPGQEGTLSFLVRVDDQREWGGIVNSASSRYRGETGFHALSSNEVTVLVGRVSSLVIGPRGNPAAPSGTPEDRVVHRLNGSDTTVVFWHELLSSGNFTDTLDMVFADSMEVPPGCRVQFIDSAGNPLSPRHGFIAGVGPVPRGESRVVGLRLWGSNGDLRSFPGTETAFTVEVCSRVDRSASDSVEDVLLKNDVPMISVTQSVREPTAMVGDILSYLITVENLTGETAIDSVMVTERLSHGLAYAGGSRQPVKEVNTLRWNAGSLGPGEKVSIVFRARVKAGQEWGNIVSSAIVSGVTPFGERVTGGPAQSSVRIVEGVFTRRGIILGSVFRDEDGDGLRSAGEEGVSGVSVFIEDGTYAVTDSAGMYSIPGVVEGTHVIRIDPATVPDSLAPGEAGYFTFGQKGEMLVELPPSGNRRADFPLEDAGRVKAVPAKSAGPDSISGAGPVGNRACGHVPDPADSTAAAIETAYGSSHIYTGDQSASPEAGEPQSPANHDSAMDSTAVAEGRDGDSENLASGNILAEDQSFAAMSISDLCFAPGRAEMEEVPLRQIAALALWMREHPGWNIIVEGHTDDIPISNRDFPSNLELSIARARTVFQVLRMNGIPAGRMDYTGLGPREPVASNSTPEGRARNRRVEINLRPPPDYSARRHGVPPVLSGPDTTSVVMAGREGICAEVVKPAEGRVFRDRDQIDVTVSSPLGSTVELYVDDIPVGREKIGQKQVDIRKGTIQVIFYGVRIKPGKNRILVVCRQFGGNCQKCVRNVYLAGRIDGIVTERDMVSVSADGRTSPLLIFLVRDESGLPVRDGIFMEVEGPPDLTGGLDRNPNREGVQVPTSEGKVVLELPPSHTSRRARIYLSHGRFRAGMGVAYLSSPRDWFLLGFGEGKAGYSHFSGSGNTCGTRERYHDGLFAEGQISFYGKGEVRGEHLLTCAVNTRPIREDRLFRRIEPEKYYPVYGDASELEFNTSSRSGTYLKLDHRNYSAMLGDFRTGLRSTEFTRYHRSFNGVKGEGYVGRGRVRAFVTRTDQVTCQEEIPADGTSGFYFLEHYPIVENSEKVRIEVRDRYRPEEIVRVDYKKINRDYDINYMDGSILFKKPVAVTDDDLNPVTIVVSYEYKTSSNDNHIYGLRTSVDITDSITVGGTAVLEEEGAENSSLVGMDLSGSLNSFLSVESEYAHSDRYLQGGGDAFRMKLRGDHGEALKWSTYYRDIDDNFFNQSFSGGKTELGSKKLGADADWRVRDDLALEAKGFRHSFRERNEKKKYTHLVGLYRDGAITGRTGFGYASHSDNRNGDRSAVLLLAGAGYQGEKTGARIEYDQILDGEEVQEYPNRLQADISRTIWKSLAAVLKHEYRTGSRTGTRHLTQIGLESGEGKDLHLFSRYRLEGAMSGQRGQAIIGMENEFSLTEHLTSTFSAERHQTVSGRAADDFTAFRTGWLYTPAQGEYRLKGEYQIRIEEDRRKHLVGLGGIKRMSERWSGLTRGELWYADEEIEADRVKGKSTAGLSFRPRRGGPLTLLSLWRLRYEKNSPAHPGAVDWDFTSSLEANYQAGGGYEVEGKFATRWVRNTFKSYTASASSFMYQGRVIKVFGRVWDVGLTGRLVHQRETRTVRYGGAIELGRRLAGKLWAGAGYQFGGHMDSDTPVNQFDTDGIYIRLRMKFNEKLLGYFYENAIRGWRD